MLAITTLFTFICGVLYFTTVTEGRQFRSDYKYYPEAGGWFKLHNVPAIWHEARLRCYLEGAVLASPLDADLLNTMKAVMSNIHNCGVFSGIHSTFSAGDYFSIEGVPLAKMAISWAPDEPDNYESNENCLIMLLNGTMADVKCTDSFPYICYKRKSAVIEVGCGTTDSAYKFDNRTGSCYKFHTQSQNWTSANKTCADEGGYLSIINSDVEAKVLAEVFAQYPDSTLTAYEKGLASIGFHDFGVHGKWWTIQGDTLEKAGYKKWSSGQPNNATGGEFCGSILRSGQLNDVWCFRDFPFICEKSTVNFIVNNGDEHNL